MSLVRVLRLVIVLGSLGVGLVAFRAWLIHLVEGFRPVHFAIRVQKMGGLLIKSRRG